MYTKFCRFHPLSEFDEGKRSCRRRLAGHNRRRRKTQPDDVTSKLPPSNRENVSNGDMDIVNLLSIIARAQGTKIFILVFAVLYTILSIHVLCIIYNSLIHIYIQYQEILKIVAPTAHQFQKRINLFRSFRRLIHYLCQRTLLRNCLYQELLKKLLLIRKKMEIS